MVAYDPAVTAGEIRVAVGRLSRQLRRLYAEGRPGADPSFLELAVLQRLERAGPASVSELANNERVTTQAISAIVGGLRGLALVQTSSDPADRRRTQVQITDAGRDVLTSRETNIQDRLTEVIAVECGPADLRTLHRAAAVLDQLAERL